MSKVTAPADFGKIKDPDEFIRFVGQYLREVSPVINGQLEFDANLKTQSKLVFFPSANQNLAISHELGKTNVQYLISSKTAACDIFRGTGDTVSQVVLQSTVAGVTVSMVLF